MANESLAAILPGPPNLIHVQNLCHIVFSLTQDFGHHKISESTFISSGAAGSELNLFAWPLKYVDINWVYVRIEKLDGPFKIKLQIIAASIHPRSGYSCPVRSS
jgi:hypothetical protein